MRWKPSPSPTWSAASAPSAASSNCRRRCSRPGHVKRNTPPPKTWIGLGALGGGAEGRLAEMQALLAPVGKVEIKSEHPGGEVDEARRQRDVPRPVRDGRPDALRRAQAAGHARADHRDRRGGDARRPRPRPSGRADLRADAGRPCWLQPAGREAVRDAGEPRRAGPRPQHRAAGPPEGTRQRGRHDQRPRRRGERAARLCGAGQCACGRDRAADRSRRAEARTRQYGVGARLRAEADSRHVADPPQRARLARIAGASGGLRRRLSGSADQARRGAGGRRARRHRGAGVRALPCRSAGPERLHREPHRRLERHRHRGCRPRRAGRLSRFCSDRVRALRSTRR